MGDIKAAFAALTALEWSDVPQDQERLSGFMKENFIQAELLANSVPIPASAARPGSPNHDQTEPPKLAKSAAETLVNPRPTALDTRYADLQKVWGKPIKISAKDNPLSVSVYKTAGHDRKGAWFARRSVHTGLKFDRWKNAMSNEFLTSLKVKKGPGSGAIRGIAGDQKLETLKVDGLGNADAWLLSSAFPGPVAPRDFVEILLTSSNALSDASVPDSESKETPRHYMVISRPLTHDEGSERQGLVRGNYESVELIREVPSDGQDVAGELIEWIMITRSDPGGGIPRFMVDRGTPGSIVADVPKFIEWAIRRDDSEEKQGPVRQATNLAEKGSDGPSSEPNLLAPVQPFHPVSLERSKSDSGQVDHQYQPEYNEHGNSSLLGSLTTAVGSTVGGYLPSYLNPANYHYEPHAHSHSHSHSLASDHGHMFSHKREADSESISSSSSDGTFASAEGGEASSDSDIPVNGTHEAVDAEPRSVETILVEDEETPRSSHEKELLKLREKRMSLEQKMAKLKEEDEIRSRESLDKDETERAKALEKAEKERKKAEEKYAKELRQLEERRKKEERKAEEARAKEEKRLEEKKRKAIEKDAVLKAQRERDDAREKLKVSERERDILEMQVEELQRENNILVQKMAGGESGMDIVHRVRMDALTRSRASSRASKTSRQSGSQSRKDKDKSSEKLNVDAV